ncbi:uncharacterized protein LOC112548816 [Alligator sinensis]|uniref:Uncharacterized protein LOC112548816 n=1 Tax=Alligator sinensis TaxID=38654 RepID=A0A3Q0FYY6_ALLSI|nr:uncharacterized protein LOC112548816 [Alligator sinensis]
MKSLPPPSLTWTGPATRLEVYVSPHVSLSAPATEAALNSTLVICLVSDFYPEALHVTLNTTCGGRTMLDHNTSSITVAPSGTFAGTYRALVDTVGCPNGTEVSCSVRQFAAETRSTIWVPGMRNEAPTQQLPAYFLLIPITAAVLVLGLIFFLVLFKMYKVWCGNKRETGSAAAPGHRRCTQEQAAGSELSQEPGVYPDIAYADLYFGSQRTQTRRPPAAHERAEYGTVSTR